MRKLLLLFLTLLLSTQGLSTQGLAKVGDIYICEVVKGTIIFTDFLPVKEFSGSFFKFRIEENSVALYSDLGDAEPTILNIIENSRPANKNGPDGYFIASSEQGDQGEILKFHYGNLAYSNVGASTSETHYMMSYIANCEILNI